MLDVCNFSDMETKNIIIIAVAAVVVIALLVFLIRRNREDIKSMNPDATDATEEVQADQERRRDKI